MDSSIPEQSADPAAAGTAVCNACKQDLDEVRDESVVSFGKHLFHVNCFRCAKCRCLVEHNTNLLLLSDGSPVCENCSYMCTICQKPIHNEAIVTGDESYHADCFRCRSCSNKIEELIFAKTNQGIWCMACHNERVARTRRHAEAKRRARKDRESRGGRKSQPDSETAPAQLNAYDSSSVSRDTSSPPTPARTPEPVQATSRHSPAPVRPLPPHPGDPSSMPSEGRSDVVTAPTDSIAMLARSGMPSLPPCVPSPTLRPQAGASAPQPAPTGTRTDAASPVPVTSAAAAQLPHLSVTADVFIDTFDDTDAADRALDGGSTLGLTAPTAGSKAHNRRSGFYGAMARPVPPPAGSNDAEGDVDFDVPSTRQTASPRRPSRDILTPQKATPVEAPQSQQYSTADLAHSTSFYDPDTLLFLTHVTSSSPGSPFHSGATSTTTGYPAVAPVSDQEQLDTLDSPRDPTAPDERADTASSKPSETARRVRESLQMSQQESVRSSLAELDVELVETLLAELDATQREIKEIKTRYNAFRRASRSAFEGFSMAREEYDKEVAARREVERQMASLRARFAEQARRLAQVDQEQATTEELKRRSKTLRTSVVGMEKHLSQLRAELALSTAQAAELVALDGSRGPQDGSPDGRALAPSSQAEMAEGLNQRLEAVKESHRAEISTLVAERDDLLREIEELKRMRDAHAAEAELLASRNAELSRLNETAARNLDDLRGPLSKVSTSSDRLGEGRGHVSTMSASSAATLFSPPPTRPTGSAARSGAVTIAEAQPAYRPTTAETASRNKFWSKNKLKNDPSKQSTSQAGVASPPPDKSPGPSMRGAAAAAEPSTRSHLFQPSSILRPVRCDYCGDKMWGLNEVRCSACGSYAHAKCAGFLQTSCSPGGVSPTVAQPAEDYGPPILASGSMFGAELAVQAEKEGGNVPAVVLKCIEVVEEGGMSYEGIYRKTGGMGQTKLITQNFERGQDFDLSDRDKFNDIAAVTSCLKNYFRSLPVPLMTHDLHEDFISATEISDPNGRLDAIALVLQRLPRTHYETARHLFLHLNRVQARAAENKMTAANLGVVFGPTVLRSPVAAREWSDMGPKTKLVEILCEHAERLFSPTRAHI